jgi:hypothetical protein
MCLRGMWPLVCVTRSPTIPEDDIGAFFALPPFKADEALVKLRRDLRELRALSEKGAGATLRWDWKGLPVAELQLSDDGKQIAAGVVKQPSSRPQWGRSTLASSGDARQWLEALKRSLKRWDDEA